MNVSDKMREVDEHRDPKRRVEQLHEGGNDQGREGNEQAAHEDEFAPAKVRRRMDPEENQDGNGELQPTNTDAKRWDKDTMVGTSPKPGLESIADAAGGAINGPPLNPDVMTGIKDETQLSNGRGCVMPGPGKPPSENMKNSWDNPIHALVGLDQQRLQGLAYGATPSAPSGDQMRQLLNSRGPPGVGSDQIFAAARHRVLQEAQRNSSSSMQMASMLSGFQGLNPTAPDANRPQPPMLFPNNPHFQMMQQMQGGGHASNLFYLQNQGAAGNLTQAQIHQMSHHHLMMGGLLPHRFPLPGGAQADNVIDIPVGERDASGRRGLPPLDPGQHPPVDLYMGCDDEVLSDHQIFLRKQVEYFEAGTLEVQSVSHGRRREIRIGQVGIRCKHCAHIPPRRRPKGSTYYPASLRALYQAAQNMAAGHFTSSCDTIGEEKKAQFRAFQAGKITAGHGGKKYWSDCAKALGILETDEGLRFAQEENPPAEGDDETSTN